MCASPRYTITLHWTKWPTSQKSTVVYTLNPESRSIVRDVMMYNIGKFTIYFYLGFAFIVTIFAIFKLIIDYQVVHEIVSWAI